MCDPFTIMMGVGTAISAVGSVVQGNQQASAAKLQAQMNSQSLQNQAVAQRQEANREQLTGQFQAKRQQDAADRMVSKQRNAFASQGVEIDSGSALDTLIDTQQESSMDQAAIQWNANNKANQLRQSGDISEGNSKLALIGGKIAADSAETAGWLNAVSTVTKGIGSGSRTSLGQSVFGF